MSRLLIDPSMPNGAKFAGASDLAKLLHFLGLCYAASNLTDGFVPEVIARKLTHADLKQFDRAIAHLSSVQPGCGFASWLRRPGGWFLHDYDDPLYDNPMREGLETRRQQKVKAGAAGGKKSALARLEKYGTAQPPSSNPEAEPEAPASKHPEAPASTSASADPEPSPEAGSKLAHAHARPLRALRTRKPFPSLPLPSLKAPPTPSVSTASLRDALSNGRQGNPGLQLAVRAADLLQRDLSPLEVNMCSLYVDDFAYLSIDDILERMQSHLDHCQREKLPLPRKLQGFRQTLLLQNDHMADTGHPKAWRPPPVLGNLNSLMDRDPDERDPDEAP